METETTLNLASLLAVFFTASILLFGLVATILNVYHAEYPITRRVIMLGSLALWIMILMMVLFILLLPTPYNFISTIPLLIAFPFTVYRVARRRMRIRNIEAYRHEKTLKNSTI